MHHGGGPGPHNHPKSQATTHPDSHGQKDTEYWKKQIEQADTLCGPGWQDCLEERDGRGEWTAIYIYM